MTHSIASTLQVTTDRASSRAFPRLVTKPLPLLHRGFAMLIAVFLAVTAEAPKPGRYRASA